MAHPAAGRPLCFLVVAGGEFPVKLASKPGEPAARRLQLLEGPARDSEADEMGVDPNLALGLGPRGRALPWPGEPRPGMQGQAASHGRE